MNIYHVTHPRDWKLALTQMTYEPDTYKNCGFIHCSTSIQVPNVVKHFYNNQRELLLLQIDTDIVKSPIVFENLEGGKENFPHIYGVLNIEAVVGVFHFNSIGNIDLPFLPD